MNRFLLDTHTILWFYNASTTLSSQIIKLIKSPNTTFYPSVASLWEIAIKNSIGKLELDIEFIELELALQQDEIRILNIGFDHLNNLKNLPYHHRDPFDRLIVAQAQSENLTVITKDREFRQYNIEVIWE